MTSETPTTPNKLPKKKPSVWWWIGGIFVLLLVWFFYQLFGPSPAIVVSKRTTFITEPLRPDGLPDYERYLLERYREGVTPENNAAVLLWQAMWPGELQPQDYALVAKELGLEQIPSAADSLVPLYSDETRNRIAEWLKERQKEGTDAAQDAAQPDEVRWGNEYDPISEVAERVLDQAVSRPWTSELIPPLAKWPEDNQGPIDLIVEATTRPRCYFPSPSLLDDQREPLIGMELPGVQSARKAAWALSARAMWHLGEGRFDQAWMDLLAIYRLARLVGQGRTLVDQLVAIAIEGIASDRTVVLLGDARLPADLARQIHEDLAAFPPNRKVASTFGSTERISMLDFVLQLKVHGANKLFDFWRSETSAAAIDRFSFDWNQVLMDMNRWCDQLSAAASRDTRAARQQAFARFWDDLHNARAKVTSPARLGSALFSRGQRSSLLGDVVAGLMLPALNAASDAEDRGNTILELTRLAAALAVYRAEHGEYPETLEDLVPGVLDELPVDLYNAKPFLYRRDGEGYLLYSAGVNGVDDRGSNAQMRVFEGRPLDDMNEAEADALLDKIPPNADDWSLRLPRPAFELPTLPKEAE